MSPGDQNLMTPEIYGHAKLPRAGLANRLFTWASCDVFCQRQGIAMLAPRWFQPSIGPLLRGESDARFYAGLFDDSRYVGGWKRRWLLMTARKIPYEQGEIHVLRARRRPARGASVIVFSGVPLRFRPLVPFRALIRERLHLILSRQSRGRLAADPLDYVIGVHVRRGDRGSVLAPGQPPPPGWSWTIPEAWYITCIKNLRAVLGDVPVRVFSDAGAEQLSQILAVPGVKLSPANPSIVDILLMSKSKVLITSSSSTFSQWGVFLEGIPSLWFPCNHHKDCSKDHPELACDTDVYGNFSAEFADIVLRHAGGSARPSVI